MRKSICFCLSFLFIILFTGCGEFVPPEPVKCFTSSADVLYNGMEIACRISANGKNNLLISVTYPENLCGFSYLWSDGIFRIGYRELYCEYASPELPQEAFAAELGGFINGLYTAENYTYSKKVESGCLFTYSGGGITFVTEEKSGNLVFVEFENMTVEFRNFEARP